MTGADVVLDRPARPVVSTCAMPNKPNPNNPQVGWRVPKDVARTVREIAKARGLRPSEVVTRLVRRMGRDRIIGRSVKLGAHSHSSRNAG